VPAPPHPFLRQIGARIRELRERAQLSQEDLADRARIDRSYMSGIERGVRNVSILKLHTLAKALNVKVTEFFDR
jgi:transcriptional regulator with XRE-family HTH domain